MDQRKTGSFLKELRKERGITQEQLAEIFGVAGRTVSRWETGINMPDLDVIIQLADYYRVEIRELFNGERGERRKENMDKTKISKEDIRKGDIRKEDISKKEDEDMDREDTGKRKINEKNVDSRNREIEEAVLQAADYSNKEKQRLAKRMCFLFACGLIAFTIYLVMVYLGMENTPGVKEDIASAALGFAYGIMLCGVLYTSGRLAKFKEAKRRFRMQLIKK